MPTWILYAFGLLGVWGLMAPLATYYGTQWTTQVEERAACTIRVSDAVNAVAAKLKKAHDADFKAAYEAAMHVPPTPETPAALADLCKTDPHCREHGP